MTLTRTRDFSVPLTEVEHESLQLISETMGKELGVKISRRDLAAKALREFIKRQKVKLGIDDD